MRNIKITLEYDGSRYSGWKRMGKEESSNTIEIKICEVLKKMTKEDIELFCASRTETGVHAYAQVVHFKTMSAMEPYEIKHYLNRYLPMDIAALDVEEKPERFHCALNAKSRTYLYRIAIGEVPSVFERKYTYYCFHKPDIEKMKEAADKLIGRHDFKKFSTVKKSKSTIKEIFDISIYKDPEELQISMCANDFLHNMPRMIASTLIDIGLSKRPVTDIDAILNPGSPETASAPAAAQGLFLSEICYEENGK